MLRLSALGSLADLLELLLALSSHDFMHCTYHAPTTCCVLQDLFILHILLLLCVPLHRLPPIVTAYNTETLHQRNCWHYSPPSRCVLVQWQFAMMCVFVARLSVISYAD